MDTAWAPPESIRMHAPILPLYFLKAIHPRPLHLAQPPSDLSFEAERTFKRNPQWGKLAACTQPSAQPQFTARGDGRGQQLYNLCPVLLGQRRHQKKSLPDNSNHFTYEWLHSQVVPDVLLLLGGFMVCWKRETFGVGDPFPSIICISR